jgi:hypothetical protein
MTVTYFFLLTFSVGPWNRYRLEGMRFQSLYLCHILPKRTVTQRLSKAVRECSLNKTKRKGRPAWVTAPASRPVNSHLPPCPSWSSFSSTAVFLLLLVKCKLFMRDLLEIFCCWRKLFLPHDHKSSYYYMFQYTLSLWQCFSYSVRSL